MAQLFKGHVVDDGDYPMPPDPRQPVHAEPVPAGPTISAEDIQAAASELEAMVNLVSALRPRVERMGDTLRQNGYQAGFSEGLATAQAEVQAHLMQAIAALTEAQQQRHHIAQQNESALADLALRIARKVIGEHLEADPSIIGRIVADTISELEPTTALSVHVHPEDAPIIEAQRHELERLVAGPGMVVVIPDEAVDRGGCRLVSPVGEVDARIETKLSVLETAFIAQRRALVDGPNA